MARKLLESALLTLVIGASALAHGGLFRPPPGQQAPALPPPGNPAAPNVPAGLTASLSVSNFPGGLPVVPFAEDRWEYWWEFNHHRLLDLRPSLARAGVGPGDQGFTWLEDDDKIRELVPALVFLLRDPHDQVRSAAAHALSRVGLPTVYPYLGMAQENDESLLVRTNAAVAIGQSRIPRGVERLRELLFEDATQDEVRAMAAIALGVLASPDASAALREAMSPASSARLPYTTRLATVYALGLTEDPSNAPFLRARALEGLGEEALQALAVLSLGRLGDRAANQHLLEELGDTRTQVRRSAAIALGVVGRPDDADVITALDRAAQRDSDYFVRNVADLSLGRIGGHGSPRAVEILVERLGKVTANRRAFVALALGMTRDPSAQQPLLKMFRDDASLTLKAAAATALGVLGKPEATVVLREAFRKMKDPALRAYLAAALGMLKDREVIEDLRTILREEVDPRLIRWSSVALGLLGDRQAAGVLQEVYRQGGEVYTRASAVHALGLIGDRTAAPFLIQVTRDPNEVALVRAFATYALGMLCDRTREPVTAVYTRDHNYTLNLSFVPELYYLF